MTIPTCHPNKKHQAKGFCRTCYYNLWKKANPEKLNIITNRKKDKYANSDDKKLKKFYNGIKYKYNLSSVEYEDMKSKQNNKCAICLKDPVKGKKLHIDHDHSDNRVRGLVCFECNWFLSKIDKDIDVIRRLIMYRSTKKDTYLELYFRRAK